MRFSQLRPSPALIVATLALVVALGGVTYAASVAPRNSVVTASIKTGAVTNPKIAKHTIKQSRIAQKAIGTTRLADGAVTGGQLADGSVTTGKIVDGAVTGAKVADHSLTGADINSTSLAVVHSITVRQTNGTPQPVAAGSTLQTTASCQPGEAVIAGGAYASTTSLHLYQSWPNSNTTWVAVYVNSTGAAINSAQVIAWASCMT